MRRKDQTALTKAIGKRLFDLRSKKKMSQEAFAELAGISRGYLSDLERGAREMSIETLEHLCRKCGTTPNKLLGF
jgi:transcriptional regulator with XRE-family HTH domain